MVELVGKDADDFINKMIERENSPPTAKQIKFIQELRQDRLDLHKTKTLICDKCKAQLIGIDEVYKHKKDNWDHFTYTLAGGTAQLCFA